MIVRTYTRRNRCINSTLSESSFSGDLEDCFYGSLSQESSQDAFRIGFSSQESSAWLSDSDLYGSSSNQVADSRTFSSQDLSLWGTEQKSKKPRTAIYDSFPLLKTNTRSSKLSDTISVLPTSTLMEAQEFGEMMEHVDEVNFALDGLRPGHPSRVRHSSLSALLSICMTSKQRRLLRAHGMAKTIINAILALNFDDSHSILAAAALFYVLTSDGQDDHLLDSYSCVHFLLKLLNLPLSDTVVNKDPQNEGGVLPPHKYSGLKSSKGLDFSPSSIFSKVQEILLSCKEIEPQNKAGEDTGKTTLSAKWIALLTMEKACLSTISLEDTSGTVRVVGGSFKDRLREHGGLEAVSDVAAGCHIILKDWLNNALPSSLTLENSTVLSNLALLLKCLKIMENATFLSKDNQNHLLGMNVKSNSKGPCISFVGLVISSIKVLSGLSITEKSINYSARSGTKSCHSSEVWEKEDEGCIAMTVCGSSGNFHTLGMAQSREISTGTKQRTSYGLNGTNITCSVGLVVNSVGVYERLPEETEETHAVSLEEGQDPFAFDEYDLKPTKWDAIDTKTTVSKKQKTRKKGSQLKNGFDFLSSIEYDLAVSGNVFSRGMPKLSITVQDSNILGDCLLTAVKVLMNLTNDNPVGCQQIASSGGLNTMTALIMDHFPMFGSCLSMDKKVKPILFASSTNIADNEYYKGKHLQSQELDFLVAILGLLVNLVEKDSENRSRLAGTGALFTKSGPRRVTSKGHKREVIPFLCSIFLASQGSGEAAGEGNIRQNDEAAVLEGEREAEKMIVEAYAALLLAFLSTESVSVRNAIAECLPGQKLEVVVPVLERFLAFHLTLNMISPETHATVAKVIESCRGH